MDILINKKEFEKLRNAVFIYSVGGGMGNIARIVGKELITSKNGKIIGKIVSYVVPDTFYINKNGLVTDELSYKFYKVSLDNRDLVIFYGKFWPGVIEDPVRSLIERYRIVKYIINILKKYNFEEVVSLGGLALDMEPEDPKYRFFFNKYYNPEKILVKIGNIEKFTSNNIVGMAGTLIYYTNLYKIPAYGILVETYPTNMYNGYLGAAKVLDVLGKIYDIPINVSKLAEKGREYRNKILSKINEIRQIQDQERKKEEEKKTYYFG